MKKFIKRAISKKRVLLVIVDLILLVLAIVSASYVWLGPPIYIVVVEVHFFRIIFMGVVFLLAFIANGLYDIHRDFAKGKTLADIITSVVVASGILLIIFFSLPIFKFPSRPIFYLNSLFIILFVYLWRKLYSKFFGLRFFQNVLVVGAGPLGMKILEELKRRPLSGYGVIGFVDKNEEKTGTKIDGFEILGSFDKVKEVVEKHNIDHIVVSVEPHNRPDNLIKGLISCMQAGIEVEDMHILYERITGRVPYQYVEESWFLYSKIGQDNLYKRVFKQAIERIVAGLILLVTSPVFILTIFLQKIFYRGSVFYAQERSGKFGKKFRIIKFRTMVENAEEGTGPVWAQKNDSRVTKFGRFLRLIRIDELPQMVNILKGDMSFVGPRPEREHFIKQFQEKIPFYSYRLSVNPGLTGWAQIQHTYDTSIDDVYRKLEYDLYYIKNMSLVLDLTIFLLTIKVILTAKGH